MKNEPVVSIVKNETTADAKRIDEMVKESIDLLGGIESFVKEGQSVVIKANFFAPSPPPITVDRRVVGALLRLIKTAKPSKITVAEAVSVGTKLGRDSSTKAIVDELGIRDVVEAEGAELLCLEDDERVEVDLPNGVSIYKIDYPKTLLDCDVLIDLPCMKTHGITMVTLGIKNYQGLLTDAQKYYAHRDDLPQKLVDIHKVRFSDLTIVDGLLAMEGNGSGEGGIAKPMNMIIAGSNTVSVDAVTCACMGMDDVLDVTTTRIAQHEGLGIADLDKIEVRGNTIEESKEDFLMPVTYTKPYDRYVLGVYPNVDVYIGGACRECWSRCKGVGAMLDAYGPERFTLIAGVDPKVPEKLRTDLDHVVVFGDCALAAKGNVLDLKNRMLIEDKGLFAPGCPAFRPAIRKIEDYLIEKGLLDTEKKLEKRTATRKKINDYYKKLDPTWVPKSEQGGKS